MVVPLLELLFVLLLVPVEVEGVLTARRSVAVELLLLLVEPFMLVAVGRRPPLLLLLVPVEVEGVLTAGERRSVDEAPLLLLLPVLVEPFMLVAVGRRPPLLLVLEGRVLVLLL